MGYPVYILADTSYIKSNVNGEYVTSEEDLLGKTKFSNQETRKIVYQILCNDERERDEIKRILEAHEQIDLKKYKSSVCILTPDNADLEFVSLSTGKKILWENDFKEAIKGNPQKANYVLQQYNQRIPWDQLCGIILANHTDPVLQGSIHHWLEKRGLSLHGLALRDENLAKVIFSTPLAKHLTAEQLVDVADKYSQIYQEVAALGDLDPNAALNKRFNSKSKEKIKANSILNEIYSEAKKTISSVAITHVQMMHDAIKEEYYELNEHEKNRNILSSPRLEEQVAYSQFKVAQFILNNPNKVIVLEGLDHKITPDNQDLVDKETMDKIIAHFPEGIPKDFNDLSTEQKKLLRVHMAPIVLLCLNQVPAIYPSSTPKLEQELCQAIKESENSNNPLAELKTIERNFRSKREAQAIDCCIDAAEESGNPEIFLVFGRKHEFHKYKAEDGSYCMKKPQDMSDTSYLDHKKDKLLITSETAM